MTLEQEQKALHEIYKDVPVLQPTDLELFEMFEIFMKENEKNKDSSEFVINLPRGYGQ